MITRTCLTALLALAPALPASAQDASAVVATVNGTDITLGHMIAMRERLPEQYQQLDDQTLYDGVLQQLIQQTALGVDAGPLSRRDELVMENERRALVASSALESRAAGAVSGDAVEAAYAEQFGEGEAGTEYNASHILVDSEAAAKDLIAQLEDGADFATLARAESTGPSGPSGGELGWFGPGAMVPAFDAAVQDLEVGEISEPVQTEFGWHVIKLNDTRDKTPPPLEEVRAQIEDQLQTQAIEEAVAAAVDEAEVERPSPDIDPSAIRDDALLD